MALDQRDYYIDRLRRRTGYVERARFRVPLGRPRLVRPTKGPGAFAGIALAILCAAALLYVVATVARALS